ncbi:hypothetical protein ABW21_db0207733 [Orbilia brochopaga]|nr:hypothetical protein ABW21_db0207733 [Drechslerella brochopaga]
MSEPPPQVPHFDPLIRTPLDPRDRLPELRQRLQSIETPDVQKQNIQALIADIEAGIPVAPFYQRGLRVETWADLDRTTQFWGSDAFALVGASVYPPAQAGGVLQTMAVECRLDPMIMGPAATRPTVATHVLNDSGSAALTLHPDDLPALQPSIWYSSYGWWACLQTAMGPSSVRISSRTRKMTLCNAAVVPPENNILFIE